MFSLFTCLFSCSLARNNHIPHLLGTNCERLAERFQLVHVSTGDLLREEVKRGGDFANDILDHMKNGEMVPIVIILPGLRRE